MSNTQATGEPTCGSCGWPIMGMHQCKVFFTPYTPPIPWTPPNPSIPWNGFNCPSCGAWVPFGGTHVCLPTPGPVPARVPVPGKRKPFTCPKCDGERFINGRTCPTCSGSGVVWGD
jgi:hypothetical protein